MKSHEILDKLINTLGVLRNEIISNPYGGGGNPYFSFQKQVVHNKFLELHGNIERDRLISAVNQLEYDHIISIPKKDAVPFTIIFNNSFFEALETTNGWYTNIYLQKQLELDLLVSKLEKLEFQIQKLESEPTLKEKLSNLTNLSTLITNTIDGISKLM